LSSTGSQLETYWSEMLPLGKYGSVVDSNQLRTSFRRTTQNLVLSFVREAFLYSGPVLTTAFYTSAYIEEITGQTHLSSWHVRIETDVSSSQVHVPFKH
jgi:hypothetical protein